MGPRRHLRNLISSRTSNRRALRVMWAWLQGAKRGLIPEIPPEFILLSKLKHAKALQKVLPEIPADFLADFKHDLKELTWRGVDRISVRSFRDAEGILKTGLVRQWKPDKAVRAWQGNPGWNACITSVQTEGERRHVESGSRERSRNISINLWVPSPAGPTRSSPRFQ